MEHSAPLTPTRTVAQRMRAIRTSKGWNGQRLADEMTKVGVPWNRGVVTKLETGRRESISVDELLTLAYVLKVSPLTLLLPQDDDEYPVTPKTNTTARAAYEWFAGQRVPPLPGIGESDESSFSDRRRAWLAFSRALTYIAAPPEVLAERADQIFEFLRAAGQANVRIPSAVQQALIFQLAQAEAAGSPGSEPEQIDHLEDVLTDLRERNAK